jgi:hypothetical protein
MNGPDHYRRAEQLIADARKAIAPPPGFTPVKPGAPTPSELHQRAITEAQVHATLALAAATALAATADLREHTEEGREWNKAAVTKPEPEPNPYLTGNRAEREIPFAPRTEQDPGR